MRIFVTEFADSKREVEKELKSVTMPIIEHLFKLYVLPNHESRNHWCSEIYGFLNKVKKLAGKNKFPTKRQILDWSYLKWADTLEGSFVDTEIETLEYKYNVIIKKNSRMYTEFNYLCDKYFDWLATELSNIGRVSFPKVVNKLNELF